jgi:hypothetical protein
VLLIDDEEPVGIKEGLDRLRERDSVPAKVVGFLARVPL